MIEAVTTADVGLGTAYERWAVYDLLERWRARLEVHTACEGPIDGMAGMAGLHLVGLARRGVHVTVALPSEAALDLVRRTYHQLGLDDRLTTVLARRPRDIAGCFDLVLTYNSLPLVDDWPTYLEEVAGLTDQVMVVSVTNPASYGVWLRRMMRLVEAKRAPELFDHPATAELRLRSELERWGTVEERAFVDCPWWPDLFVPTGQTLLQGLLGRLPVLSTLAARRTGTATPSGRFTYTPEHFPLFPDQPGHDELQRAFARHPAFDRQGDWLGRAFGHHHAYRVRRRKSG